MRYALAAGLVLALAWSSTVLAGTTKVIELKDGSAIVGEVIDEGDSGYLVRKRDGTTVRVKYDDIENVSVLTDDGGGGGVDGVDEGPPEVEPEPAWKVDGVIFPDERSALEYRSRRITVDWFDLRSGSWKTVGTTRSSERDTSTDLSQPVSLGASYLLGAPIEIKYQRDSTTGTETTAQTHSFSESVDREYRLLTGEGVVLLECDDVCSAGVRDFFRHIGRQDVYFSNGVWVGIEDEFAESLQTEFQRRLRKRNGRIGGGTALLLGGLTCGMVSAAFLAEGELVEGIPLALCGAVGIGAGVPLMVSGARFEKAAFEYREAEIEGYAKDMNLNAEDVLLQFRKYPTSHTPYHFSHGRWKMQELLPYISEYNEQLAASLGAE